MIRTILTAKVLLNNFDSSYLLRVIFLLLALLLSSNSWTSPQDIVSGMEWAEVVDSLEEIDEKRNIDGSNQPDDGFFQATAGLFETDTNQGNLIYCMPPQGFDYPKIPFPPPKCLAKAALSI